MTYTPSGLTLCTVDDVKAALRITDANDDDRLGMAVDAATRQIQNEAGRVFFQDDKASQRWYVPETPWLVEVEDFMTTDGLIVATYPSGRSFDPVVWDVSDYQLEPLNGLLNGQPWAFESIRSVGRKVFPAFGGSGFISAPPSASQALIAVTAKWGWSAPPVDAVQAAVIQSITIFKSVDAPFGATPFAETGVLRLRVALHPTAAALISDYTRTVLIG